MHEEVMNLNALGDGSCAVHSILWTWPPASTDCSLYTPWFICFATNGRNNHLARHRNVIHLVNLCLFHQMWKRGEPSASSFRLASNRTTRYRNQTSNPREYIILRAYSTVLLPSWIVLDFRNTLKTWIWGQKAKNRHVGVFTHHPVAKRLPFPD